ncbi:COBRA-like protein 1 [Diospyros lotus]|uniref:COBRA-like protein 1 n=1 Tax=Diospyros lotus TaxID=55363 RepID=UPI0022535A76|nr:COBRA-like protein 1 [Diospyros lotus]
MNLSPSTIGASIHLNLLISRGRMALTTFPLTLILLLSMCRLSACYDPLDPNGNITVTFDILQWRIDGYVVRVTIQNYYQYRHFDQSGWQLGWTWSKNEVIWSMLGAFATQQGNCSSFKSEVPHSCKKDPIIVDLMPDTAPINRSEGCCHGGRLAAWAINPSTSFSSFLITVGNLESNTPGYKPLNLTLMAPGPGYTCGPMVDTDPTVSSVIGGRREEQVFRTWKSTCTYSTYLANRIPICCVSLSTFYNPTITSCPHCSCGCKPAGNNTTSCIREDSTSIQSVSDADIVHCTDHMCPLQVHWHFKNNYRDHWRLKLTISNYNYRRNYSNWNVLVQHPGFSQTSRSYSFNSTMLPTVGITDEVALFWGIDYYNTELLNAQENQVGSVTTEILLKKDPKTFTLRNGWAFPRRIYVNGENCQMSLPDSFPMLPNGSSSHHKPTRPLLLLLPLLIYLTFKTFAVWL